MFKNYAGQKLTVYAFDATTNLPKAGDAANITAYVNKDDAGVVALADTSATEIDNTNAKGFYTFDLAQAETNADKLHFTVKSLTANVVVQASPPVMYTTPPPDVGDSTVSPGTVYNAALTGTTTLGSNGTYFYIRSTSLPASGAYWNVDLNSKTGGFNLFSHEGGVRLSNLKASMFVSIHGSCSIYVDTTCTGGRFRPFGPHLIIAGASQEFSGEEALAVIKAQGVDLDLSGLVTRDGLANAVFTTPLGDIEGYGSTLVLGSLYGAIQQAQESAIVGTTQTVYKTDGSTILGTKTVTKTTGDAPIRGIS